MKILLIEDDQVDVLIVRENIKLGDICEQQNLIVCKSLKEGVDYLSLNLSNVDVIISDLGLPDGIGADVIARLAEAAPDVPIIVLTGNQRDLTCTIVHKFGADDFLSKDEISPVSLRRSIENSIERKKLKNQLFLSMEKVEKATRAKSRFLANMSHEIRTPLNLIIGTADLLNGTNLDVKQKKYVDTFIRSGEHLLSLISDVLDISKIESEGLTFADVDFDLEETVNGVADLVGLSCRSKKLQFEYYFDQNLRGLVKGDPGRIKQILFNLANNSVKFTNSGSVRLSAKKLGSSVEFTVEDTGIGVPKSEAENIFSAFRQIEDKNNFVPGGTGLGLAIVKEITDSMGGAVRLDPSYTGGARFILTVPLAASGGRPRSGSVEKAFEGKHVLIVASNAFERKAIADFVNFSGATSKIVHSGAEALSLLRSETKWDHVFLDLQMPDKGGLTILEELETSLDSSNILFILPLIHRADDIQSTESYKNAKTIYKPLSYSKLESIFSDQDLSEESAPAICPPLKILVAEDDIDNRELVQAYLDGTPHQVSFAHDGNECVAHYKCEPYDLILMDIQMPIMNGHEATKEIRRIETSAPTGLEIPIFALSANAFSEDIEEAKCSGFSGYLTKPIRKKVLLELLEKIGPVAS